MYLAKKRSKQLKEAANAENHKMYSGDQCSEAQRGSAERSTQHGAAINTALQKEVISQYRSEEDNEQGSTAKRKMFLALLIKSWGEGSPQTPLFANVVQSLSWALFGGLSRPVLASLGIVRSSLGPLFGSPEHFWLPLSSSWASPGLP